MDSTRVLVGSSPQLHSAASPHLCPGSLSLCSQEWPVREGGREGEREGSIN